MQRLTLFVVFILLILAICIPAYAEWPTSIEVGGFTISEVAGNENADGSGKASGKLVIPSDGSCTIELTRSGSGVVMGSTRSGFSINGIKVDGSFVLDRTGLQGTGTVHTGGKAISDANLTFSAQSGLAGTGSVHLSPDLNVGVQCKITPGSLSVSGAAPRQVSVDTPLAVYTFRGTVEISSSDKALKTAATGTVERKGKIGGTVDTFGPLTFDVSTASGEADLSVGGSKVTLDLW